MKSFMKCFVIFALMLAAMPSLASGIYADLTAENAQGQREGIMSMCVFQGEAYCLSGRGAMYRPDTDGETVHAVRLTIAEHDRESLSQEYRNNLELDTKKQVDTASIINDAMRLTHIMSDGERLFGFNRLTGILYTLEKTETDAFMCDPLLALDWRGLGYSETEGVYTGINGYALNGDTLYLALERYDKETEKDVYTLTAFDLKTGERSTFANEGRFVAAYGENTMLYVEGYYLYVWDFEKGETLKKPVLGTRSPLCGVEYDPASGMTYCVFQMDNTLYSTRDFLVFEKHSVLPVSYGQYTMIGLIPNKMIVLSNADYIMLRDSNAIEPGKELRVLGGSEADGFASAYPNISMKHTELWSGVENIFAEHMVLGKDQYDIYQMPITPSFPQLKQKGFFYDLGTIDGLADELAALYPNMRDLLTDEQGRWIAYPVRITFNCFGVSPYVAGELGLAKEDIPKTYGGLVDFLLAWQDNDKGIYPFAGSSDEIRLALLRAVDRTYQAFYFQNPEAALLLREQVAEMIDKINFINIEGKYVKDDFRIAESIDVLGGFTTQPDCLFTDGYSIMPGKDMLNNLKWVNGFDFLPLTLTEETPLLLPVDELSVYTISPYSKNIEEASTYLSFFAEKSSATVKAPFFAGEWLEEAFYYPSTRTVRLKTELANLTERLDIIEPENRKELEAQIEDVQKGLAAWETVRYAVTPEKVAIYAERVPYLALDALTAPVASTGSLFSRLLDHQIDGQTYLDEYYRLIEKISREQQ